MGLPESRAGNVSSTRFHDPRLIPAGSRHSIAFSPGETLPGMDVKNGEGRGAAEMPIPEGCLAFDFFT